MATKKDKDQKYRSMRAYIGPKDPKRYVAQKLQHGIRQYEKMMDKEPWTVDPKKYIALLEAFEKISTEVERERKKTRVNSRVDKTGLDTQVRQKGQAAVRQDEPFSMDA